MTNEWHTPNVMVSVLLSQIAIDVFMISVILMIVCVIAITKPSVPKQCGIHGVLIWYTHIRI